MSASRISRHSAIHPQSVIRQGEATRRKLSVAYHGIGRTLTLNCGRIAEHLSNNQTSAIADAAKAMIAALPEGYRGEE